MSLNGVFTMTREECKSLCNGYPYNIDGSPRAGTKCSMLSMFNQAATDPETGSCYMYSESTCAGSLVAASGFNVVCTLM
jgi:hypothetical protein